MVFVKEYRIPLPLSVEEYRIAQLYMIQKKSRLESTGDGSRVEILKNTPYTDGPGGSGQYTKKIYHIGSHIPGWLKSFLPKTALRVEEEAWNAYPYTKTRTTCPFMDKFYIDVETFYHSDAGLLENVFNLSPAERARTTVDLIDPVKDAFPSHYYKTEEDPKKFVSKRTKRGPLEEDWLHDYIEDPSKNPIMCAYKLIKVEFKYWGIQSKIEQYIQDGARRTVLIAHRQAWAWQDEWCNLSINQIRKLEEELQHELLKRRPEEEHVQENGEDEPIAEQSTKKRLSVAELTLMSNSPKDMKRRSMQYTEEIILGLRMTSIEEDSDSSYETPDSDEEFVDALDSLDDARISTQLKSTDKAEPTLSGNNSSLYNMDETTRAKTKDTFLNHDKPLPPLDNPSKPILLLVFHGGGVADPDVDSYSKIRDFKMFESVFSSVASMLYPSAVENVALRLVDCPSMCPQIVEDLKKISVFGEPNVKSPDFGWLPPTFPLSCIPLLLVSSVEFYQSVEHVINKANSIYKSFLDSTKADKDDIKVCILADCVGALLVYGALCSNESKSGDISSESLIVNSSYEFMNKKHSIGSQPVLERDSSIDSTTFSQLSLTKTPDQFTFDVASFFCCGSPIGMILMKQRFESNGILPWKPCCDQVYNMFLPFDPVASRLEPLIDSSFSRYEAAHVPRFQEFPFSTEILYATKDSVAQIRKNADVLQTPTETLMTVNENRKISATSSCSSMDTFSDTQETLLNSGNWWGSKRIDYMLYCPDGLQQFPSSALTHLCYSSYWESKDMVAFILWQILDETVTIQFDYGSINNSVFQPVNPTEKWIKKRTSLKIKNMHPNHRANDVIALEGTVPRVSARFVYGPIDVASLTGERVDVYLSINRQMTNWKLLGSGITDTNGRIDFPMPEVDTIPQGIHTVKMVVRGDHSSVDCNLAVIPNGTEAVVFSIDGSFLAAYSVRAVDPKIRGGAVDVVRHWQELGYVIIYVTSRLLFQKHQVMGWLAQHNFPFGMVSFCETISKDYQKHKQRFLHSLVEQGVVSIHAAYGSSRDIGIYTSLGLSKEQIFIVGKPRHHKQANSFQVIREGYASHLSELPSHQLSRHAIGQICSALPWTCFGIPTSNSKANKSHKHAGTKLNVFHRSKSNQDKQPNDEAVNETQVARRVRTSSRLWHRR